MVEEVELNRNDQLNKGGMKRINHSINIAYGDLFQKYILDHLWLVLYLVLSLEHC